MQLNRNHRVDVTSQFTSYRRSSVTDRHHIPNLHRYIWIHSH